MWAHMRQQYSPGFACGAHNSNSDGVPHLRPMNVSRRGILDLSEIKSVPTGFNDRRLSLGDVLFNNTNSPELIGKTAFVSVSGDGLAFSNHMTLLRFNEAIDPKFAALQLHFLWMMKYFLHRCVKHVNQASISAGDMGRSVPIVAPPINEQHRIVTKIEELFSELDNGIESLKTARKQLKIYRQAVLKHAFEGKLTAKWREENADKLESPEQLLARIKEEREASYQQRLSDWKAAVRVWEADGKVGKKPSKPAPQMPLETVSVGELGDLPMLPCEWTYTRFGMFITAIEAGKSFKCDEREPLDHEVGVAKVSAVTWSEYDESASKTCMDAGKENQNYFIKDGDFLLSRANTIELVGACVIVKQAKRRIMLSDKTLRLAFNVTGAKAYFLQCLRSHLGRNEIMKRSTGNQDSMRNIGQDRIRNIIVPVCSIAEMEEVVSCLDNVFMRTRAMEAEIEVEIRRSETLRQAILKKAFSGQLVAHDPNDEPASVLLARIQAEKAEQEKSNNHSEKKKRAKATV